MFRSMSLLHTLLELGDSTSTNLGFAYDLSPRISYGEETITESNLLEIKRRHPKLTRIETFTKLAESRQTGADWEWHLIGRAWTLKLRVQAKRITKSGSLKGIFHKSKKASSSQVDLLITSARKDGLLPVFCFYCAERHRKIWTIGLAGGATGSLETGCLLAPADAVKSEAPTRLEEIEPITRPWHFLWADKCYTTMRGSYSLKYKEEGRTKRYLEEISVGDYTTDDAAAGEWGFPSVSDLNNNDRNFSSFPGLFKSEPDQLWSEISASYFEERGIRLLMLLDVSRLDPLDRISQ